MIAGARLAVHVGLAPVRPWHLPLTMTLLDSINALETIIAAKFLAYAVGVFIDFLISHSNAHLSYTRNDKHGLTHKLTYRMCLLTVTS